MQVLCALMALAAYVATGATQVVTTSHRKVSWGWGCGGHCAVNISGESDTALGNDPPDVHLEDHGTQTLRLSDPDRIVTTTTRWKSAFHGTSTTGASHREFSLKTDLSECSRTEETITPGQPTATKKTGCSGPPRQWKLVCDLKDVQVKGRARPAWVCSPPQEMNPFGTEFPWVFGAHEPITTIVSGEPHPLTRYE